MGKPKGILRFAIMVNGPFLTKWQYNSIKLLEESGIAKVVLLVNNASVGKTDNSLKQKLANYLNKNLLYKLSSRFIYKVPELGIAGIESMFQNIPVLNCHTLKKGKFSEFFSEGDISEINKFKLDFIIRYGFGIIKGEILNTAKYGVWSYHHGDENVFRGGPAGFWEIYKNSNLNGVVLQKLNNLIDAGVIINRRSYLTVKHSYSENLNKLLANNSDMPLQVCRQILNGDLSLFQKAHSKTKAPINRLPNNWQMVWFYVLLLRNRIIFHLTRLFKQEDWNLGIIHQKEQKPGIPELKDVIWLTVRKKPKYAADGFCFNSQNTNYIVFEDYDFRVRKGKISMLKLDKQGDIEEQSTVLSKPFHLAYPFLLKYNNAIYMIPETAENNTVELYKWDAQNEAFEFERVLLNIGGVDSSLVNYQSRWWLFCGIKGDLPNEKLHIFYSDNMGGPYTPHLLNPVKVDPRGSRPAGQFIVEKEELFRPAQCSQKWYGEKINWFRIKNLTPVLFEEELVGEMTALPEWEYNKGVHTFSQTSSLMLIDAKKRKSGWHAFVAALKNS